MLGSSRLTLVMAKAISLNDPLFQGLANVHQLGEHKWFAKRVFSVNRHDGNKINLQIHGF